MALQAALILWSLLPEKNQPRMVKPQQQQKEKKRELIFLLGMICSHYLAGSSVSDGIRAL